MYMDRFELPHGGSISRFRIRLYWLMSTVDLSGTIGHRPVCCIDQRQALDAASFGRSVKEKFHGPHLLVTIACCRGWRATSGIFLRLRFLACSPSWAYSRSTPRACGEDLASLALQHLVDYASAVPAMALRQGDDILSFKVSLRSAAG